MITISTYYKGEIYIPQAKPSVADEVVGSKNDFSLIVDKYEEDCLIKCLGISLYREFLDNIDTEETTLIKAGSDAKWDELMNGVEYVKNGKTLYWRGIRFKTPLNATEYNRSFLANYVYWFYMSSQYTSTTTTGEKKNKSANAENIVPSAKVVKAWNEFVEMVQGIDNRAILYNKNGFLGVDYYRGNNNVSLYQFINDSNAESVVYDNFEPINWSVTNQFGI